MLKVSIPLKVVKIESDGFHLLVDCKINGKNARLLVDTGASKTVFDKRNIKKFTGKTKTTKLKQLSTGLGTHTMESHTIELRSISFGKIKITNYKTVLLDMSHVHKSYKEMCLPAFDGVLGSDLLMELKAIINYQKKVLNIKFNKKIKSSK